MAKTVINGALGAALLALMNSTALATVFVQCPGDTNGDADWDDAGDIQPAGVKCLHLAAGDGVISMANVVSGDLSAGANAGHRRRQYIFGFSDMTGVPPQDVYAAGALGANFSAPTITLDEDDEFYLTLSNVGMVVRPDLADPHSVHYHGQPQTATIFDGLPETAVSINQGASLTYYYKISDPGTYMYHCHVEATEHMQMGMLGNWYVRPKQNKLANSTPLGTHTHLSGHTYAYNDGDGSTRYDVEYPIQLGSFDPLFHDASESVQPLPFADMRDRYAMLNGRGYPDTINPNPLPNADDAYPNADLNVGVVRTQKVSSLITAAPNQKVLLRISNLNITNFYTLATLGIPMKVVGRGARIMRGGGVPAGKNLEYVTNSVTLGGGESVDVILDTAGATPGTTYLLYTTNLNFLSNDTEDFGGMMTEIRVN